jgi:hypothetical protein
MPGNNEQKEANHSEIISDREIWSAIRYLDPELDQTESEVVVAIVVLAIACILGLVLLFVHGL